MQHATVKCLPSVDELTTLSAAQMVEIVQQQARTIESLHHQLDWFKRQLFGVKSERAITLPSALQLNLADIVAAVPAPLDQHNVVAAHTRRVPASDAAAGSEALPFFDEARVPVETIRLPVAEIAGLAAEQFEVIGEKTSFRLAQRC